jgi:hypothetical protein
MGRTAVEGGSGSISEAIAVPLASIASRLKVTAPTHGVRRALAAVLPAVPRATRPTPFMECPVIKIRAFLPRRPESAPDVAFVPMTGVKAPQPNGSHEAMELVVGAGLCT